jgi:hypothetical protein
MPFWNVFLLDAHKPGAFSFYSGNALKLENVDRKLAVIGIGELFSRFHGPMYSPCIMAWVLLLLYSFGSILYLRTDRLRMGYFNNLHNGFINKI